MCGKDRVAKACKVGSVGSPPRVRERLHTNAEFTSFHRITPACAGKTLKKTGSHQESQDHPRVCGKDYCLRVDSCTCLRITPACAGMTCYTIGPVDNLLDHPACAGKTFSNSINFKV